MDGDVVESTKFVLQTLETGLIARQRRQPRILE